MSKTLAKVIRNAISSKSCRFGGREVLGSLKGKNSKLVVCSGSLPDDTMSKIQEAASSSQVPIYRYEDTSVELGRLCNKPFRVSVLSIASASESEISALLEEVNK
ncbi:MAG: ribosomal L7Ae/L30e/S12e/Gadd45 family protein [Nitrososphaerales archaeon]